MNPKPIDIQELSKVFRTKRGRKILALDSLTLQVEEGEVFGFLGPNGAGKSTSIKTLVGQIKATSGTARIFGCPVDNSESRKRIGYLPENPALYDFLTAREFLRLVGCTFGMDDNTIARESLRVLELLDLTDASERPIRGYSKGMVQRLGLAQTLLHDPDLYILDEPMSGLDPLGRALVKDIMVDLKKRGKTVFFSTHVTADVEAVCDRVAVIVGGKLQAVNVVSDLLDKGIVGYTLQLRNCPDKVLEDVEVINSSAEIREVFISRSELSEFTSRITNAGGEIMLVEPRRRNLEQFFLDVVHRETG
jgi:ABC-2 type transport system ATP-binding protein